MKMITMRVILICGLSLVLMFSGAVAQASESPEDIVRETTREVLDALKEEKGSTDPGVAEELVTDKILPIINFETFARLTLGIHWRKATPDQRRAFSQEFQSMLIRTYAKYMLDYAETRVNYLPTREEEKYTFVRTELIPGNGKTPLNVTYRFKEFDEGWKVIDVTVDGLSMAKNFRTSFVDEVDRTSLDALIERLSQANSTDSDLLPDSPAKGS